MQINTRFLGNMTLEVEGATVAVNGTVLKAPVVEYLLAYGLKQSVDDAGASPDKAKAGSEARLAALLAGEVPSGGGARLNPVEKELRDIIGTMLRQTGVKAAEVAKMVREPKNAFAAVVRGQIARKMKVAESAVPAEKVTANVERLFPGLVAKAEARVAERKEVTLDIE